MQIDFNLPDELIATYPTPKRDQCRLLIYDRKTGDIQHAKFHDLHAFLSPNYFLIFNQAKVLPCRMMWHDSKLKKQEVVFLKMLNEEFDGSTWEALVSGPVKVGMLNHFSPDFHFMLLEERKETLAKIRINKNKADLEKILSQKGQLPLPPYIIKKRNDNGEQTYTSNDQRDYQTVYGKKSGAVAAPTAGLHFSNETFSNLKSAGIEWEYLHLAVGWGTFQPLTMKEFVTKKLHPEYMEIPLKSVFAIQEAQGAGKNFLAVGTTSVRALETWALKGHRDESFVGETDIFIMPPFEFKMTEALLTNFHLPKSSLMLLVAAFLGKEGEKKIVDIYKEAIEQKYRFYSYGDCMLIL